MIWCSPRTLPNIYSYHSYKIFGERHDQQVLKEILTALDSLCSKRLIPNELINTEGDVCVLGALGKAKNIQMSNIDVRNHNDISSALDIPIELVTELMFINDEFPQEETPEQRFIRMQSFIKSQTWEKPKKILYFADLSF